MVSCSFAASVVAATLVLHVDAHSYMIDPIPTWPVSWSTNNFAATIAGQTYLPCPDGMSYSTAPELSTEAYWTAFNESSYTSLKDLVDKTGEVQTLSPFDTATLECGFSLANGTARDLPSEYVEWNQLTEGHDGPCEVWCDDVLAFEDDNCAVNYPGSSSQWPYDVSKCEGASQLTAYWIALHGLPWQVYINCVPLMGSVNGTTVAAATTMSSGSTSAATATTTTTAPSTSTAAPLTTTAPSTITAAPTATTATPTTADPSTAAEAEGSECGSLDMAGSDESDCGSLDVAGSDESDCGSLDDAGDETDESTSSGTSTSAGSSTSAGTTTSTSTSTTTASSVAGESGSVEVAGDAETASNIEDSECGSLDVAEDDSECGSLDVAEDSECGSLDMAKSTESDVEYTGSTTGITFKSIQGTVAAGTVAPQA